MRARSNGVACLRHARLRGVFRTRRVLLGSAASPTLFACAQKEPAFLTLSSIHQPPPVPPASITMTGTFDASGPFKTPLASRDLNTSLDASRSAVLGISPTKPQQQARPVASNLLFQQHTSASDRHVTPFSASDRYKMGIFPIDSPTASHSHVIACSRSLALLLGRAKASDHDDSAPSAAVETAAACGSVPVHRASLPGSARHVSRDHAVIFHTPFGSSWAVKILGQNGLIVNGKRRKAGNTLRIEAGETVLNFFGVPCLFMGDGNGRADNTNAKSRSSSDSPRRLIAPQDGRSPAKRARLSISQPPIAEEEKDSNTVQQTPAPTAPIQSKFVGNIAKRPQGAPLSPPTSSPAHFVMSSSPPTVAGKHVSSIAHHSDEEDDDDEEEDVNASRSTSPTLARRAGRYHDDSGVLVPGGRDSEDEASQAVAAVPSEKTKPATPSLPLHNSLKRREASFSDEELASSPRGTPGPTARDSKKVKFQRGATPSHGVASVRTTAALPLSTMQAIQAHYRSLVSSLASTYDLQGLLAGAIVFHRTATISATEAVRSVLTANPGLMRGEVGPEGEALAPRGEVLPGWTRNDLLSRELVQAQEADAERVETWQRKAWREKLEACLLDGDCFGIIQRAGKDASGNPLESWYYYDKEHDPDTQRAANLGAFAKPMRAALKSHKPIFWRKSESAMSSASGGVTSAGSAGAAGGSSKSADQQSLATESQWGSAGNVLNALMLTAGAATPGKSERALAAAASTSSRPKTSAAASGAWEETQFEETEATWDKEGDMDFEMAIGSGGAASRRQKSSKKK